MTPREFELLAFLKDRIKTTGVCPTYTEMAEHTGVVSKSGIHRLVTALETLGLITRTPGKAQSICIVDTRPVPAGYRVAVQTIRTAIRDAHSQRVSFADFVSKIESAATDLERGL